LVGTHWDMLDHLIEGIAADKNLSVGRLVGVNSTYLEILLKTV